MTPIRSLALPFLGLALLAACQPVPGVTFLGPTITSEAYLVHTPHTLGSSSTVVSTLEPPNEQPAEGTDLETAGVDRFTYTFDVPTTLRLLMHDDLGEPHTASLLDSTGQLLAQAAHGSTAMPQTLKKGNYVLETRHLGGGGMAKQLVITALPDSEQDSRGDAEHRAVTLLVTAVTLPTPLTEKQAGACAMAGGSDQVAIAACLKDQAQ